MQHAVFHTIAFLVFSCLAFSTPATRCHIFMSRNFVSRIFSVPGCWRAPSQKIYEFFVSRKRLCYGQRAVKRVCVCVCCMLTLYTMSLPTQSRCSCRQCRRTKPSPTRGAHVDLATTQARPRSRGRQTSPARRLVRLCASLTRPRPPPPPAGVMSAKPPRRR